MPGISAATLHRIKAQKAVGMLGLTLLYWTAEHTRLPPTNRFLVMCEKWTPFCLTTASRVFCFSKPKAFLTNLPSDSIRDKGDTKIFLLGTSPLSLSSFQAWGRVQPQESDNHREDISLPEAREPGDRGKHWMPTILSSFTCCLKEVHVCPGLHVSQYLFFV